MNEISDYSENKLFAHVITRSEIIGYFWQRNRSRWFTHVMRMREIIGYFGKQN